MTGIAAGRLVMAALFREEKDWDGARQALEERFGPLDDEILRFPFDWTDYYGGEMGTGLVRLFCSFRDVRQQDELAGCKRGTVDLERRFSVTEGGRSRRRVNLDPGILTLDRLVLATGKDFSHRIYLGRGVFAELALVCREGGFHPLEWTYPDYRRDETLSWCERLRRELRGGRRRTAGHRSASAGAGA